MLAAYGLCNRVNSPTHNRGGLLDIVASRIDSQQQQLVEVIDIGLSDHQLLRWAAPLVRPQPVYVPTKSRPWRMFDAQAFRMDLLSSQLCHPEVWSELDVDDWRGCTTPKLLS